MHKKVKLSRRQKIKQGIRKKIVGTKERPRLSIFRSNKEMYVYVVDDSCGKTLFGTSTLSKEFSAKGTKTERSKELGKIIGSKCKEESISKVVFDRNGYLYHGRVKALAEGARETGLQF